MNSKEKLFEELNSFFDHIFVITLKRSTDRHDLIKKSLDGLNYSIYWAVDGNDLDINDLHEKGLYHRHLSKLLRKREGNPPVDMTKPQLGCALSHVNVYKEIIENNYERALIFEDDISINLNAIDSTLQALRELPDDWEVLRLGYFGANSDPSLLLKIQKWTLQTAMKYFQRFERLRLLDSNVINCWFDRPYSEHLNYTGYHFGSHAYGVTKKGAEIILNYQTPIVQRSDNAVSELCSYEWLNAFGLKDRVFYQNRKLPSTIDNQS